MVAEPQPDPLARVRHDLKGPLTIIKASAQLVARDIDRAAGLADADRERLRRRLDAISRSVDEMSGQIDRLRIGGDGAADNGATVSD